MSARQQAKLIQLFNNLFVSGFTLGEMVTFLRRSQLLNDSYTSQMEASLLEGDSMAKMMAAVGFSDTIVTQMSLADIHGNTQKSLTKIESYLRSMATLKKKLVEVATYPIILLSFLVLIMIGLKNYLIPQLYGGNLATRLVASFPLLFFAFLFGGLAILAACYLWLRQMSRMRAATLLSKLPFIGSYVKLYLTAYYAREWGNLIGQGVDLSQIVRLMQEQKSQLFNEIGRDLEENLLSGQTFCETVLSYPFFLRELGLIIEYGEVKAKLGAELDIYADETWETFFLRLQKATQLIQPLIFIFVALVIVMIYAAMLLPMYQNMEFNV